MKQLRVEIMSGEPSEGGEPGGATVLAVYKVAGDQWEHAEQLRWTVLYNFLVASTILLLGWGAVYQTGPASARRTLVLLTLCLVGAFVSVVWVGLSERANRFVKHHSIKAAELEASLPPDCRLFAATEEFRSNLKGPGAWMSTRFAVSLIPSVFFLLFTLLGCFSLDIEVRSYMSMTEAAMAWATVVNAIMVAALVGITAWYAREAGRARRAAKRQAAAAEASLRALRHQAELEAGLSKTIVKTAMQTALRNIEYWEPKGNAYNLAVQHQLPNEVELLPPNSQRAVEHARRISVEGSEELSSSFDSLRLAELELQILAAAKPSIPEFFQSHASNFLGYLGQARLDLEAARARFADDASANGALDSREIPS